MRRYFSKEDFITFINLLEEDKTSKVFTESLEDGSVESYEFRKIKFAGETITLYEFYSGCIGLIQDTPVAPWEDYAEGVFEDLTRESEYKVFIDKPSKFE